MDTPGTRRSVCCLLLCLLWPFFQRSMSTTEVSQVIIVTCPADLPTMHNVSSPQTSVKITVVEPTCPSGLTSGPTVLWWLGSLNSFVNTGKNVDDTVYIYDVERSRYLYINNTGANRTVCEDTVVLFCCNKSHVSVLVLRYTSTTATPEQSGTVVSVPTVLPNTSTPTTVPYCSCSSSPVTPTNAAINGPDAGVISAGPVVLVVASALIIVVILVGVNFVRKRKRNSLKINNNGVSEPTTNTHTVSHQPIRTTVV